MLSTAIVLFREILEIALLLGVILAATRDVTGRARWVWAGIGGGVLGSALLALFTGQLSQMMEGMGQEVLSAAILALAAMMIAWTVVWMQAHARAVSQKIKAMGKAVQEGDASMAALAVLVSLTMWREGAEIVLFMTGILSTTKESLLAIVAGGMVGALAGGAIGLLVYLGLLRLPVRHFFRFTSWLLLLLACGMASQSVGFLSAAGLLPDLINPLWDTSAFLSDEGMAGRVLHSLIGYTAQPTGMQALVYAATFTVIVLLLRLTREHMIPVVKLPQTA